MPDQLNAIAVYKRTVIICLDTESLIQQTPCSDRSCYFVDRFNNVEIKQRALVDVTAFFKMHMRRLTTFIYATVVSPIFFALH